VGLLWALVLPDQLLLAWDGLALALWAVGVVALALLVAEAKAEILLAAGKVLVGGSRRL